MDEAVANLFRDADAFLGPLRVGDGFEETKFLRLCASIKACRDQWAPLDYVPKVALSLLVDIVPGTLTCRDLYGGDEFEAIDKAACSLNELIIDAVAPGNQR